MAPDRPRLVLASQSPRRRQLLAEAGYQFDVVPPEVEELPGLCSQCGPAELVTGLALQKAADVVRRLGSESPPVGRVVVGCDTVVECAGQVLGKPRDEGHAREMLAFLSGRVHRVYSGLCVWPLWGDVPRVEVAVTTLRMDPLTAEAREDYLASHQWEGKAGAFGYQDRLGWVHIVQGSESNVVGLPLELLSDMIQRITPPSTGDADQSQAAK